MHSVYERNPPIPHSYYDISGPFHSAKIFGGLRTEGMDLPFIDKSFWNDFGKTPDLAPKMAEIMDFHTPLLSHPPPPPKPWIRYCRSISDFTEIWSKQTQVIYFFFSIWFYFIITFLTFEHIYYILYSQPTILHNDTIEN
jgi:hypothetical protein